MKRILALCLLAATTLVATAGRPLRVGVAEARNEGRVQVPREYINAIALGGHTPVIISDVSNPETLRRQLKSIDILILHGGEDVAPERYGAARSPQLGGVNEPRDEFEHRVFQEALRQKKPVMGICRGMQILNVFLGGTLYQDLPTEYPDTSLCHRRSDTPGNPTHYNVLEHNSRLYKLLQCDTIGVNSTHHQAVKRLGRGLRVAARATDGVIEAVECDSLPIVGVQFHPERLLTSGDMQFLPIFRNLKDFCKP